MVLRVSIPSFRKVREAEDVYTVFLVNVWMSGHRSIIEKRYSQFEELHKQLKKVMKTPEFPPKKVLKWNPKVLEQRRMGLDSYMQGVLENSSLPSFLFMFLETDVIEEFDKNDEEENTSHQPVLLFDVNAYLQEPKNNALPNIVSEGVKLGLYSNSNSSIAYH